MLQLDLHVHNDLVRAQRGISGIDWSVVWVIRPGGITPGRIPITRVPVPPAATHEDDPAIIMPVPITIVPVSAVVPKRSIVLPGETIASPVVRDLYIATASELSCPIPPEISFPADRDVVRFSHSGSIRPEILFPANHDVVPFSNSRAIRSHEVPLASLVSARRVKLADWTSMGRVKTLPIDDCPRLGASVDVASMGKALLIASLAVISHCRSGLPLPSRGSDLGRFTFVAFVFFFGHCHRRAKRYSNGSDTE